jgi:hypothetical protein
MNIIYISHGGNIMLLTELQQESMINRIEKIVAILMEERPLFKEELNPREMVKHLYNIKNTIFILICIFNH